MRRIGIFILLLSAMMMPGCMPKKSGVNWEVNLDKDSKDPYGAYLAYESMKYFFPGVKIEALPRGFRYSSIDDAMRNEQGVIVLVLTGLDFYLSEAEMEQLLYFINAGNEVLLFCSSMDSKLEEKLKCYKVNPSFTAGNEEFPLSKVNKGNVNEQCLSLAWGDTAARYGYSGRTIRNFFRIGEERAPFEETEQVYIDSLMGHADGEPVQTDEEDKDDQPAEQTSDSSETDEEDIDPDYISEVPWVLGYANEEPNFVRYQIGRGYLTLHAAPLVMSNYFLLQDNNLSYLSNIWNSMSTNVTHIYWNSYYKHRAEHSDLGILWRHPATRWAVLLSILTLALYVLLELKRRQPPIPVIKPLDNSSVTFAETVGRLYYNNGKHENLAEKMVQHFSEWVRMNYYLNTNELNEQFVKQLVAKSGQPREVAQHVTDMMNEVRSASVKVDEAYLYELNKTIEKFYKKDR